MNGEAPSYGSLFAGIGGFDLGLERAGWECKWQVEIDEACNRVLRRRFRRPSGDDSGQGIPGGESDERQDQLDDGGGGSPARYTNVTTVGRHNLSPVDLICGGFPCQDLSVAGRRKGLAGERSGLFFEFMRIVAEIAPRWVLIENVPGLLSSPPEDPGADMGVVLGTLGELGYGWAYRILDAQFFGVAQRRRRVFIVGCLGDPARAAEVLFEPESCSGDLAPSRATGARVATSLETRPADARLRESGGVSRDGELAATLNSGGNRGGFRTEPGEHLVTRSLQAGSKGNDEEAGYGPLVANTLNANYGRTTDAAGSHGTGPKNLVAHALTAEGSDASEDGTGRGTPIVMAPAFSKRPGQQIASRDDGLSFALTSGEPPRLATSTVRRLTPRECERLQGFPDDWTEGESDSARYRMLGNAVCVPVAEWLGARLLTAQKGSTP